MNFPSPSFPRLSKIVDDTEWIISRWQTFAMLTLETERVLDTTFNRRMPSLSAAFRQLPAAT